ncbi:MAG: oligosaccharide flippase family protein [Paracoccus sp. (in: a-proteobacteria)]
MAGFRLWIGASAADTLTRLSVQLISTMVVARILSAEEFGLASMVLGVNTVMAAFIGMPFEESLAQRRRLLGTHLETALYVSTVLAVLAVALSAVFGPLIEHAAHAPGFAAALVVSSLLLFAQGPGAVAKAMARRQRRFVDLAICNALSTVIGCGLAVLAAMAGWGIYALILQRLLPNVFYPVLAAILLKLHGQRIWVPIRWHGERFRELFRFSWLNLADVGVSSASPAILAFLVNGYFGQAVLGQLNIALRVVEPLRMAMLGAGHNLAFSVMVRLQSDAQRLTARAGDIVAGTGFVVVPAFIGLGVSAPVLLPALVGPGWDQSVPLAQILCLAVAFSLPFRFYYSGYSALGRPEYGLISSTLAIAVMAMTFVIFSWFGLHITSGIAYAAYEATTVVVALTIAGRILGRAMMAAIARLIRIWIGALIMAAAVHWLYLTGPEPAISASARLSAIILSGAVIYPLVMLILCPQCLRDGLRLIRNR